MPKLVRELLVGAAGSLIASFAIWAGHMLFDYISKL